MDTWQTLDIGFPQKEVVGRIGDAHAFTGPEEVEIGVDEAFRSNKGSCCVLLEVNDMGNEGQRKGLDARGRVVLMGPCAVQGSESTIQGTAPCVFMRGSGHPSERLTHRSHGVLH